MTENKREKFVRLAELRVNNALKSIQVVSNLANKSSYEYDDNDAKKIIKALKEAVSDLELKFKGNSQSSFKL